MGVQMRYQRGVPLTGEERAGGGQGAGRSWAQGNMYGGNPNVPAGAYGGAEDYGAGGAQWQNLGNWNLGQIMQQLLQQYQPQESPSEAMTTRRYLQDPVGFRAREMSAASMGPTFDEAFKGRMAADTMTPAQIMASGGMSAKNQWASQLPPGSKTASGVDTDELRKLNAANLGRYRTYM